MQSLVEIGSEMWICVRYKQTNENEQKTISTLYVRDDQHVKHMINDTWNVMSLCRAGSLTVAAGELARYKLDLVGVQEIRWDKGGQ